MNQIQELEKEQLKKRPKIKPGDIVSVYQEIEEAGKKRTQVFKGTIIRIRGAGSKKTFTVRRISLGVGVERTYPLHLPSITKIKISKSSKVKRAKLYYLREKKGKAGRLKEKGVAEDVIKFLADQEKEEVLRQAQDKEVAKEKTEKGKEQKEKAEREPEKAEGQEKEKKAKDESKEKGQKAQAKQKTEDSQDKS